MKTASGAVLGSAFFAPGHFFVDFGVPLGSLIGHFGATFGRLSRLFRQLWATMCFSFDRGCSGTVLGSILDASGCLPVGIFTEFWVNLGVASVVRCIQVLFQIRPKFVQIPYQSLFCRRRFALVGLPFNCRGGGRAERVKFAVPQRGAGVVLNGSVKSPVPEGFIYPSLPSRRRPQDRRTFPWRWVWRPLASFFSV